MALFKHWSLCDQTPVHLDLDPDFIYYLDARAWHIKGWLGGRHSYLTFYSSRHTQWLVVEYSDYQTLDVQGAQVLYSNRTREDYCIHAGFVSDRDPRARWFGARPRTVSLCRRGSWDIEHFTEAIDQYPLRNCDFNLWDNNCNTFTSFVIYHLDLDLELPVLSWGSRSALDWIDFTDKS